MTTIATREQDHYRSGLEDRQRSVTPPMPRNMMLDLTNGCNHACIFCSSPHQRRKRKIMDDALVERILAEAAAAGVEEVGFYNAGDPFVHKGLPHFVRFAKERGFRYVYLSSNGALAIPERAKAVIDAGLDSIKFSINAGSRETYRMIHGHDDWDKVIANLRFLSEYRKTSGRSFLLAVTYVIVKQNADEVELLRREIGHLVDEVSASPFHTQMGQMLEAERHLAVSTYDPWRKEPGAVCTNPFKRLHVTSEGYLALCCVDYQNYLAVEDLNRVSLADAWNGAAFQEQRRRHLTGNLEGTLCSRCWHGGQEALSPINPALAETVDFDEVERGQLNLIQSRLKGKDLDP